jgi:hypothetical protein
MNLQKLALRTIYEHQERQGPVRSALKNFLLVPPAITRMRLNVKPLIVLLLAFACLQGTAQQSKPAFHSIMQGGLLEGQRGSAFQLQAINGYAYKTWFAGIGAGLDYYHTRSIPVFLNLRKAFFAGDKSPFLYASGGYHFPWLKAAEENWFSTKGKGGLYYDIGLGYQVPVMKKSAFFFSAGFSGKDFSVEESDRVWITPWPMPEPNRRRFDHNLRRLSIQTGFRL